MSVATARALGVRMALAVAFGALVLPAAVHAQGVTTAAARGVVTDEAGQPVEGATITLIQPMSGRRYQTATSSGGRFFVANVEVGQYTVEARAIGFRPTRLPAVTFHLGQIGDVSLRMERSTVELEAITVTGEVSPLINSARTGQSSAVSDTLIQRLPSLNRNFADFIQTAPSVVVTNDAGRFTIAGQHNRANAIQIDGAINNDLFQLNSSNGQPGGRENARPIGIDAVQEFQVLIAPFDVRQSGFTGGMLNAVTRSGTNQFHGSLSGYMQSENLVGKDSAGGEIAEFTRYDYAFTLGGPIVRDRIHFFVAGDVRQRSEPFGGLSIRSDTTNGNDSVGIGIRRATAERVQQIAIDSSWLGFDPGDWRAPVIENPGRNFFVKVDWQLGVNSHLEASYNYSHATNDNIIHNSTATGQRDGYELSRSGYTEIGTTNSWRAKWSVGLGARTTNELLLSASRIRQPRDNVSQTTTMFIGGDRAGTNLAIGAERFSHDNNLDQDIYELTDNLTLNLGRHVVTVGTHNEFKIRMANDFFPASLGLWQFTSVDSFARRQPSLYSIALPLKPGGPNVSWGARQVGFYVQDLFTPNSRLTLTFGLRGDLPLFDWPDYNRTLDSVSATDFVRDAQGNVIDFVDGINTQALPNRREGWAAFFKMSNWLWSPRVGFNYDLHGDGSMFVRGGVGIFTGRPPYLFFSNAYSNTGASQATLTCTGTAIPAFTVDATAQPTACLTGSAPTPPIPAVVYFDPTFNFPQNLRFALGFDRRLPWDMVATFDGLYTRFLNQMYLTDVNLIQGGFATGEGNRPQYGSATTGNFTPRRRWRGGTPVANLFNDVIENRNSDEEWALQLAFQLQKRFSNNLELNASYTWSRSRDLMSYGSDIANSNLRFSPLNGTLENRNLSTSRFDIPHQVKLSGTANLPYGVQFTLQYVGRSGLPFTYTITSDANGDGLAGNDQVYVPLSIQDISLCPASPAACTSTTPTDPGQYRLLENFINSQSCLNGQRGRIMERNSCRDPWRSYTNARVAKVFRTFRGQSLELSADIFNVLAFLGLGGQIRTTGAFEATDMLSFQGYNSTLGRSRYRLSLPTVNRVSVNDSRWRMVLGARYGF